MTYRAAACLAAALLLQAASLARAEDWPQWHGLRRDGTWHVSGLPERFPTAGLNSRWRRPIGGGYAGIAVSGGRVYTLDRRTEPAEVERVLCLDAAIGRDLWTHEYPVRYDKMEYGNGPRSTPTVHDGRVYTFGARGHLMCLDAARGTVLWSKDTVREYHARVPTWGHACSPLVDGDRLIVQIGGEPGACLVAFDWLTGKEIWRNLPDRPGYSSPVIMDMPGSRQLVYWTPEHLTGLDPATGKVLWQIPYVTDYDVTISDPVGDGGMVLVSDYWKGSKAVRLDRRGTEPSLVWQGPRLSLLMSTPLVRDGHVYALDKRDGLKCIELKTGNVKWQREHVTPPERNPHASLVWAGNRALILNARGELIMARLSPQGYRELSRAKVIDETWAHPAYADGCVFVRNDKEIACVPLKP